MSSWYSRSTPGVSNTRNKSNFVTIRLGGGLGNRIFQILAAQHFAEKTGRTFCLVKEFIENNPHESSEDTMNQLMKLFPTLQFYQGENPYTTGCEVKCGSEVKCGPSAGMSLQWNTIKEEAYMMYQYQPDIFKRFPGQDVILEGYFMNSKYFPKIVPNIEINKHYPMFFLHIRLGDYVGSIHDVGLTNYYKEAIKSIHSLTKDARFLVLSNEPKKAELYIKSLEIPLKYTMSTAESSLDVLKEMSSCYGGICANSTLSWFGSFFQKPRGKICMPSVWMKGISKNQTNDFYPSWVTVIEARPTLSRF